MANLRFIDRARFVLGRLILRGLRYRLLLAAGIVLLVAVSAGWVVALLDKEFSGPGEAMWWAFLRLSDPGYLGDDEGVARRSISTVVTVLGYVLFLGLLVAILTQWLHEMISKLASGVTPVAVSEHVIVLGWTHRTASVVRHLLRTRGGVERFLERQGARQLRIVVMADPVDETLAMELRERLGELWDDRQVLLRSGSPLRIEHLERVAFRDAAVLILPGAEFGERNPEAVDAETIKTLLTVARNASESDPCHLPLAVAELYDGRRAAVAGRAYGGASEFVAGDEIVSRIIAQSIWRRGLAAVFSELLTLDEGNAIYLRQYEGQDGARFGDLRGAFRKAILLGTVRPGARGPALNPDPDTMLTEEDHLVFIAERFADCVAGAERSVLPMSSKQAPRHPALGHRRVLVLGWNRKIPALLREFERYGQEAFQIDIASSTPLEQREALLERFTPGSPHHRVHQILAAVNAPGVLEQLDVHRYDNIVLLASERLEDEEHADANTVATYLTLRSILAEDPPQPEIFVELMDEENRFLFTLEREDVLVSSTVVSYMLSQVALRRELAVVVAELSRAGCAQMLPQPARDYVQADGPVRFEELERAAAARGEIAIGLRTSGEHGAALVLNPDRDTAWALLPDGEILVLTTLADPDCED